MPTILIENLTKEEKKMLDVAKAMSGAKNWKEFVIGLVQRWSVLPATIVNGVLQSGYTTADVYQLSEEVNQAAED